MKVPLHQRMFNWGFYTVVGYCALGAFLSATNNAIRVIPPSMSIPLALFALITWASVEFYLRKKSVLWINEEGRPLRVTKLGAQRRLGFLGSIVLLLVPYLVANFSKQPSEPKEGSVGVNAPLIGVKIYGVERKHENDNDATKIMKERLRADDYQPIVYSDLEELVDGVLRNLDEKRGIRELTLFGYGRQGLFTVGNGQGSTFEKLAYMDPRVLEDKQYLELLGHLKGRFLAGARVNLIGCYVGAEREGAELVFKLSKLLGTKVCAPIGMTFTEKYDGSWQAADPDMVVPPSPLEVPK